MIIAKAGKPAVKLVPVKPNNARTFWRFHGQIEISYKCDSPDISYEIADEFDL